MRLAVLFLTMFLMSGCGHEFRPSNMPDTTPRATSTTSGSSDVGFSCLDSATFKPVTAEVTIGLYRAFTPTGYVTFTNMESGTYQLVVFTRDYNTYYCEVDICQKKMNITVLLNKRTYRP